ncbi:MAG: hypothetical protein M0C28_47540 [Candidatus Moduliflexus flocculans]|nr:hypothetical protein [Candidatus Moduliflexus flocculans]
MTLTPGRALRQEGRALPPGRPGLRRRQAARGLPRLAAQALRPAAALFRRHRDAPRRARRALVGPERRTRRQPCSRKLESRAAALGAELPAAAQEGERLMDVVSLVDRPGPRTYAYTGPPRPDWRSIPRRSRAAGQPASR